MTESEFNDLVDETLIRIEESIDDSGADVDYENSGGILTLIFDNDSQIIINRQTPVKQLWVAARAGGFHYDYDADSAGWKRDSDGEDLSVTLKRCAQEQGGEAIDFDV